LLSEGIHEQFYDSEEIFKLFQIFDVLDEAFDDFEYLVEAGS
jgi:hypothetical protein